jgi:hypothetical protein
MFKLKGLVSEIGQTKQITEKFSLRQLVVKQVFQKRDGDFFEKHFCFQFANDKIYLIDGLRVGDEVEVEFNPSSRNSKGNWYTSLDGQSVSIQIKREPEPEPAPRQAETSPVMDANGDDLPF